MKPAWNCAVCPLLWILSCATSEKSDSAIVSAGANSPSACLSDCSPPLLNPRDAGGAEAGRGSTADALARRPLETASGVELDAGADSQEGRRPDADLIPSSEPQEDNLPAGIVDRFPRSGASGLCTDLSLHIQFDRPVSLGTTGQVRLFSVQEPTQVVQRIDLEVEPVAVQIGGRALNRVQPIFVENDTASIALPPGSLAPNREYFVEVDSSVFQGEAGPFLSIDSETSWRFSTGDVAGLANSMVVDWRGTGDFCSVQGALNSIPTPNVQPVELLIRAGTYHEMLVFSDKSNITLRGEEREQTVIAYPNNENLNPGTAARAMVTAIDADDLVFENLTLHNTTPQGGGQAETLRVRGDRITLRNSNFKSLQDTLLLDGNVYIADSLIEGNVDFVWGRGAAYFERSEIRIVGRSGVIVQARNSAAGQGYAFVDCEITSEPDIGQSQLARIDVSVYPASQVAFIDCQMAPQISAEGWTVTGTEGQSLNGLLFGEFRSRNESGQLLEVSGRHPASRQLTVEQAAQVRDRAVFLNGWDPLGP